MKQSDTKMQATSSTEYSNPDLKNEIDLTKNPAFKKIPKFYKDTFPGLFD